MTTTTAAEVVFSHTKYLGTVALPGVVGFHVGESLRTVVIDTEYRSEIYHPTDADLILTAIRAKALAEAGYKISRDPDGNWSWSFPFNLGYTDNYELALDAACDAWLASLPKPEPTTIPPAECVTIAGKRYRVTFTPID